MTGYLHALQTWNPPVSNEQAEASEGVQAQFDHRRTQRVLRRIYKQSAIDRRHTAVGESGRDDPEALFHDQGDGKWHIAGTGERNRRFMVESCI